MIQELLTWINSYNEYRQKMNLYYQHFQTYLPIFKSIKNKTSQIESVLIIIYHIYSE